MNVYTESINLKTNGHCDVIDITGEVQQIVSESDINSGNITIFIPGSTAGITTIEFESGAINDLREAFNRLVPQDINYAHNMRWGDGNGHSHIRASILGTSLTVPFTSKKLLLGTWQQIIFVDFDNRSRNREIILQLIGE
ncbi:MAG: YjbQ family protein [Candidatus Dadabacteria bacterium]|nr:YjbQ family protein [Candidatus Dadabacteria bacterium]NIQ16298.1 YjbQ family protein [Candidatus Dadabacteria bacterium]